MSEFISKHPNLKKVFFHELGHYIADALNEKHFGAPSTKLISFETPIRGEENHHQIQYLGRQVSEDDNNLNWRHESNSIESIPYKLVSTLYGCIFQYIYNPSSALENCYRGNGINDAARIKQCADEFIAREIRVDKLKIIYALAEDHAKTLAGTSIREMVLEMDLNRLLIMKDEIYKLEVDLDFLKDASRGIIEVLEEEYLILVERIKEIINAI